MISGITIAQTILVLLTAFGLQQTWGLLYSNGTAELIADAKSARSLPGKLTLRLLTFLPSYDPLKCLTEWLNVLFQVS